MTEYKKHELAPGAQVPQPMNTPPPTPPVSSGRTGHTTSMAKTQAEAVEHAMQQLSRCAVHSNNHWSPSGRPMRVLYWGEVEQLLRALLAETYHYGQVQALAIAQQPIQVMADCDGDVKPLLRYDTCLHCKQPVIWLDNQWHHLNRRCDH